MINKDGDTSLYDFKAIDKKFIAFVESTSSELHTILIETREQSIGLSSENMIELAIILEKYLIDFFNIQDQVALFSDKADLEHRFYKHKRNFVHRYAGKKYSKANIDLDSLYTEFYYRYGISTDEDFILLLESKKTYHELEDLIVRYAAARLHFGPRSKLFSAPSAQEFDNLININSDISYAYDESHYCIKCHKNNKDSCSEGLRDVDGYKTNPLGNILKGCPLDIKISEMIELFSLGKPIAAFAVAIAANPLLALTGKRICNDCSKACIYQKQQPVDVPLIESKILEDVLNIDFGFEIYYLLSQWNPINVTQSFCDSSKKYNILVVGSGPSGIALAHYLLQSNCFVTMIEGQKVEPLNQDLIRSKIKHIHNITEYFDEIKPQGFGGVCEYGITDRWNKANLLLARIMLERNSGFKIYGSIKFGVGLTYEDAKANGFDHIALACGAGKPNIPMIKGIDAAGVRCASDFLMSSYIFDLKKSKNPRFFIDLPLYVVGGGLTSIDAATEAIEYYIELSKKVAILQLEESEFTEREIMQIQRLRVAGTKFLNEEERAKQENNKSDLISIINDLGGVHICYRNTITQSPAYRQNHEELRISLQQGVNILKNCEIQEIHQNKFGDISHISIKQNNELSIVPCGTLLIASGTGHINKLYDSPDISFWGDMLDEYQGSVVKAIASAKYGYKNILNQIDSNLKDLHS